MLYTTVTTKGQVVIPEEIRERLGVKAGQRVIVDTQGDKIIMKIDNVESKLNKFRAKVALHLKKKGITVSNDDINQAKQNLWKQREE